MICQCTSRQNLACHGVTNLMTTTKRKNCAFIAVHWDNWRDNVRICIDFIADGRVLVLNSGQVTTRLIHMHISLHVLTMSCNGWLQSPISFLLVYSGTSKGNMMDVLPTHMVGLYVRWLHLSHLLLWPTIVSTNHDNFVDTMFLLDSCHFRELTILYV